MREHTRSSAFAGGVLASPPCWAAARWPPRSRRGRRPQPQCQQAARAAAPIDIAGTWAQVTTEDWQWRYITPAKGDYTAVPLTAEANKIAQGWDPDADVKAGNQCKPFGAASIMRLPTRMQIAWVDDNTLKFDWDLGTQTRDGVLRQDEAAGCALAAGPRYRRVDRHRRWWGVAAAAEAAVQLRVVRRRRLPRQQAQQLRRRRRSGASGGRSCRARSGRGAGPAGAAARVRTGTGRGSR